jgi:hypothetical protein
MGMTLEDKKALKRGGGALIVDPIGLPIPAASAASGVSRSGIYRAAAEGKIILRKHGRSTIVDMASMRAFIDSLPIAQIGAPTEDATK